MLFGTVLVAFCNFASAAVGKRAALQQITSFGENPGGLNMYIYVPDAVLTSPGVILSLHGASGDAQRQFSSTPYATLAEQYGFIAVYPESPDGPFPTNSNSRDGGGASESIAQMVNYVTSNFQADAHKVFITGISAGGAMAFQAAGAYPELFTGVIVYSAGSTGNLASLYPGYGGTYPKLRLYLGSADQVISQPSFNTTLLAWSEVHGYGDVPEEVLSNDPTSGYTTFIYGTDVEGVYADGVGHPVPTRGDDDMLWFGFADNQPEISSSNTPSSDLVSATAPPSSVLIPSPTPSAFLSLSSAHNYTSHSSSRSLPSQIPGSCGHSK